MPTLGYQTGLTGWFEADAITGLVDGAAVGSWVDQSASALNATQAAGTQQPTLHINILNGLPIVRFVQASSQVLSTSAHLKSQWFGTSGATIFIVQKYGPGGNVTPVAWSDSTANDRVSTHTPYSGTIYWDFGNYTTGRISVAQPAGFGTGFHRVTLTTAAGTSAIFVDGTSLVSTAITETLSGTTTAPLSIGAITGGTAIYFDGDIAAVLIYDHGLADADRQTVDTYLTAKYFTASGTAYFVTLAVTTASIPSIAKAVGKGLSATSTTAPALQKAIAKTLSATSTSIASITKGVAKTLAATSSTMAALATLKAHAGVAYFVTLAATSTTIATMQKAIGKNVGAVSTSITSISKGIAKTLATTSATIPALQKAIGKSLSAVSLSVPALAALKNALVILHLVYGKLISAAGTGAIRTRSGLGKIISRSGLGNLRSK